MTTNKATTATANNSSRAKQNPPAAAARKLLTPLELTAIGVIYRSDGAERIKNRLFKILHLAFESDTMDMADKFERSNYFFMYSEICLLLDAANIYVHQNPLPTDELNRIATEQIQTEA